MFQVLPAGIKPRVDICSKQKRCLSFVCSSIVVAGRTNRKLMYRTEMMVECRVRERTPSIVGRMRSSGAAIFPSSALAALYLSAATLALLQSLDRRTS